MKTETNLGIVAMSPKGLWNATTAYNRLNTVYDVNSSYVCLQANTGKPLSDRDYWQVLIDGETVKQQGLTAESKGNAANTAAASANEAAENANTAALEIDEKIATKVAKETLFDNDSPTIKQEVIDPMQGRYTSVTTPEKNGSVKWTGSLTPIGTDDFMIEFALSIENGSAYNDWRAIKFVDSTYDGLLSILGGSRSESHTPYNNIFNIYFKNSLIAINRTKPLGKQFHIILCKNGLDYFGIIDGIRFNPTNPIEAYSIDSVSIEIAYAKNTSLLRKFNFADEAFAKSLYNGGRWMEKVIGAEYISALPVDVIPVNINVRRDKEIIPQIDDTWVIENITGLESNVMYFHTYPMMANFEYGKKYQVGFDVEVLSGDDIITHRLNVFDRELHSRSGVITASVSGQFHFYTNNNIGKCKISNVRVQKIHLQNEYLPSSLTKTSWRDLQGGSNLTPTNADQMTFCTAPLLNDKLVGDGAPTETPDARFQEYLDETNDVFYKAKGTINAADWIIQQ